MAYRMLFLTFTYLFSTIAIAASDCGKQVVEGISFSYCIHASAKPSAHDVLYYLHGGGGSEHSWKDKRNYTRDVMREWAKSGRTIPTVITISFGETWILSEIASNTKPALYPLVVNHLMPLLEEKMGGLKGRRMLLGESMGGFNAAQLLLKNGDLFDRVALVCPGIATIGPHSSQASIDDFMERHKPYLNRDWVTGILSWMRSEFPSEQDWLKHDPLALVKASASITPRLHVSCGKKDEYGFFEGAEQFAELAKAKGAFVQWEPLAGRHCASNPKSIADFLSAR